MIAITSNHLKKGEMKSKAKRNQKKRKGRLNVYRHKGKRETIRKGLLLCKRPNLWQTRKHPRKNLNNNKVKQEGNIKMEQSEIKKPCDLFCRL